MYSIITKKKCACGCGKWPSVGCKGLNISCVPEEERQQFTRHKVSQRRAANLRNLSTAIHKAQLKVGKPKAALKRQVKPISKFSKKMLEDLKIFRVLKKDYLKDHPICECGRNGCKRKSKDLHHKKGRGIYLNDVRYFLALSRVCHSWVNENPKEAMELGLTVSRLTN